MKIIISTFLLISIITGFSHADIIYTTNPIGANQLTEPSNILIPRNETVKIIIQAIKNFDEFLLD